MRYLYKVLKTVLMLLVVFSLGYGLSHSVWAADQSGMNAGQRVIDNLGSVQQGAELPSETSPVEVVSLVIQGALGLVAVIFFIMIISAGFSWMTAGGNEESVKQAKKNIGNAVIGLVVILFAYAITYFVFNMILNQGATEAGSTSFLLRYLV